MVKPKEKKVTLQWTTMSGNLKSSNVASCFPNEAFNRSHGMTWAMGLFQNVLFINTCPLIFFAIEKQVLQLDPRVSLGVVLVRICGSPS